MLKKIIICLVCTCMMSACTNRNQEQVQNGFVKSMGCIDEQCTDETHYHDCEEDCDVETHYHDCEEDCHIDDHHHSDHHH